MPGIILGPGGGVFVGPGGGVVSAIRVRHIDPAAVSFMTNASIGQKIADLSFVGFETSSAANASVSLISDADGRVALAGSWASGFSLVVGVAAIGDAADYTLVIQVGDVAGTFSIALSVVLASSAVTLFSASVDNADAVPTWQDQEISLGQHFSKGDVPTGTVVQAVIDGNPVPCQVSERIYWGDGSLKHALVRMLVPAIAVGGSKTVTWQRTAGVWNDTALHASPSAITGNVTLEYAFTSWKGRNSSNVLTEERGPMQLNSNVMFNTALTPAPTIEKVMSGPLCNEWRVIDMATVGTIAGAKHANQGGILYVRAWGGTAIQPKRIQFLFRTIYGWSTNVGTDEQGLRVNVDLKVDGTTVRGASLGTTGWSNLDTWKGGFLHSCDTDGTMDWFDVDTGSFVNPPKMVYRHNVDYGVTSRFIPPFDVDNSAVNLSKAAVACLPGKRGPLRQQQDDVADAEMITWTVAQPVGMAIGVFARGTAAQVHNHMTTVRAAGWGMGAMSGVGFHRDTRKIINYLPPAKQSNLEVMGASLWTNGGTPRPANAGAGLNNQISGLDAAHFPQMAYWPALLDGDQHFLDMMYHEVTLPGVFGNDAYGFSGTSSRTGVSIQFGGIQYKGQIRGVGHNARPLVCAMGLGRPSDPHHTMAVDYFRHWVEMTREIVLVEDAWRGGLNATDGRRFQDLKLLWPNNVPQYKIWMHSFGLHALSYGWAVTEDSDVKERADWWAHAVTVTAGGWHNNTNPLMKPDPYECMSYSNLAMDRDYSPTSLRRYYHYGMWRYEHRSITYKADGQTVSVPNVVGGTIYDGMIITPAALRNAAEPNDITDATKFPTSGLVEGDPYYAVQSSGTTCKLSLTLGGAAVTFDTGGADIVASCNICPVAGWHPATAFAQPSWLGTGGADYPVQIGSALAFYQHYCAPDDLRVALARNNIHYLKSNSNAPTTFDPRGANVVPRIPTWKYSSAIGGYIDVTDDSGIQLVSMGGTATAVRRPQPTTIGQSYTWTFTSDAAIERRIGTTEDGAELLANASVTGAFTYTFTATTTETWLYLQRLAAGTVNVTGMTFGLAEASQAAMTFDSSAVTFDSTTHTFDEA